MPAIASNKEDSTAVETWQVCLLCYLSMSSELRAMGQGLVWYYNDLCYAGV